MPTLRKKANETEDQKPEDHAFVYSEDESDGVNSNPATQSLAKAQEERQKRLKEESRPPKPPKREGLSRIHIPKEPAERKSSSPPPQDSDSWRERASARVEKPYNPQESTLARRRSQRRIRAPVEERSQEEDDAFSDEAELAPHQYTIFKLDTRDPEPENDGSGKPL